MIDSTAIGARNPSRKMGRRRAGQAPLATRVDRVRELIAMGLTHADVGIVVAFEAGRRVAFKADSVRRVLRGERPQDRSHSC